MGATWVHIKAAPTLTTTAVNVPMTVGIGWARGDFDDQTQELVVQYDGENIPVQWNTRSKHEDGSVRHGVLSFIAPKVGPFQAWDPLEQDPADSTGTRKRWNPFRVGHRDRFHILALSTGTPIVTPATFVLGAGITAASIVPTMTFTEIYTTGATRNYTATLPPSLMQEIIDNVQGGTNPFSDPNLKVLEKGPIWAEYQYTLLSPVEDGTTDPHGTYNRDGTVRWPLNGSARDQTAGGGIRVTFRWRFYTRHPGVEVEFQVENMTLPDTKYVTGTTKWPQYGPYEQTAVDFYIGTLPAFVHLPHVQQADTTAGVAPTRNFFWCGTSYMVVSWSAAAAPDLIWNQSLQYLARAWFVNSYNWEAQLSDARLDVLNTVDDWFQFSRIGVLNFDGYLTDSTPFKFGVPLRTVPTKPDAGGAGSAPNIGSFAQWDVAAMNSMSWRAQLAANSILCGHGSFPMWAGRDRTSKQFIPFGDGRRIYQIGDPSWANQTNNSTFSRFEHDMEFGHFPNVAYLCYLKTGRRYAEDILSGFGMFPLFWTGGNNGRIPANHSGSLLDDRYSAWGLRALALAAFLTPDGHYWKASAQSGLLWTILDSTLANWSATAMVGQNESDWPLHVGQAQVATQPKSGRQGMFAFGYRSVDQMSYFVWAHYFCWYACRHQVARETLDWYMTYYEHMTVTGRGQSYTDRQGFTSFFNPLFTIQYDKALAFFRPTRAPLNLGGVANPKLWVPDPFYYGTFQQTNEVVADTGGVGATTFTGFLVGPDASKPTQFVKAGSVRGSYVLGATTYYFTDDGDFDGDQRATIISADGLTAGEIDLWNLNRTNLGDPPNNASCRLRLSRTDGGNLHGVTVTVSYQYAWCPRDNTEAPAPAHGKAPRPSVGIKLDQLAMSCYIDAMRNMWDWADLACGDSTYCTAPCDHPCPGSVLMPDYNGDGVLDLEPENWLPPSGGTSSPKPIEEWTWYGGREVFPSFPQLAMFWASDFTTPWSAQKREKAWQSWLWARQAIVKEIGSGNNKLNDPGLIMRP